MKNLLLKNVKQVFSGKVKWFACTHRDHGNDKDERSQIRYLLGKQFRLSQSQHLALLSLFSLSHKCLDLICYCSYKMLLNQGIWNFSPPTVTVLPGVFFLHFFVSADFQFLLKFSTQELQYLSCPETYCINLNIIHSKYHHNYSSFVKEYKASMNRFQHANNGSGQKFDIFYFLVCFLCCILLILFNTGTKNQLEILFQLAFLLKNPLFIFVGTYI